MIRPNFVLQSIRDHQAKASPDHQISTIIQLVGLLQISSNHLASRWVVALPSCEFENADLFSLRSFRWRKKKKADESEAKLSISIPTLITALGLMVTIMLAIAGAVAGVYQTLFIPAARTELELKIDNLTKQHQEETKLSEIRQKSLQGQVQELQKAHDGLIEAGKSPVLLSPKNDEVLISTEIKFSWDYKPDQIPHYIIEIIRVSNDSLKRETYSVLQPKSRTFFMPVTDEAHTGEYLWRVRPGLISEGKELATGPWSAYQSFWVFTSVKQKIAHMRTLSIGMYPSFTDKFNLPVAGGKYEGLSVELGKYIANELSERLPQKSTFEEKAIRTEVHSYAWQDLLTELSHNSVDIVISSVTATKKREEESSVLFSRGYYVTHSMLISYELRYDSSRSLFENLREKRIGALKGTTNERAAYYLAKRCNCGIEVKATYVELIESKSALFKRDVDLLLTDDIWLTGESNLASFTQFGSALDSELADFYLDEYGRLHEEYGVVVPKNGGAELLALINEVLGTDEAQRFLGEAEKKARNK